MAKRGKEGKRSFADLEPLAHRPFATLAGLLPESPPPVPPASLAPAPDAGGLHPAAGQGGNSCLIRLQKRSGGKQVTLLLHCSAGEALLREIKRTLGVGGSCKENHLEIQGDKRQELASFLARRGYRVRMG
jgi:translation initiation factor 1 (eIF-1/SUI1)